MIGKIMLIGGMVLLVVLAIAGSNLPEHMEEVSCYDERGSEIKELNCVRIVQEYLGLWVIASLVSVGIIIVGMWIWSKE